MNVLVLSHTDVARLLTMDACIEVMADALRTTAPAAPSCRCGRWCGCPIAPA